MARKGSLRSLDIILTSGCNLTCAYCYQNDKSPKRMEWETLRASIDLLLASERRRIQLLFLGGEPLLQYPLMQRAVSYARERRPPGKSLRFAIITNGTLLDDEKLAFLVEHDFKTQLSFDGVPRAQDLRGAGTFARLDRLLDHLRRDRPGYFARNLEVSLTLMSANLPYLSDSIVYFIEKGVEEIAISPVFTHDAGWKPEMKQVLDRHFRKIFQVSLRHFRMTRKVPVTTFRRSQPLSPHRPKGLSMCGVGRAEVLTVDVDGQVEGCTSFARSMQKLPPGFLEERLDPLRLGDLRDPGLRERLDAYPESVREAEIFDGKIHKHSSYGKCRECRFYSECGVCPVSIGHIPGNTDPHRIPDFLCAYNLVSLEYRRKFPRQSDAAEMLTGGGDFMDLMKDFLKAAGSSAAGGTGEEALQARRKTWRRRRGNPA